MAIVRYRPVSAIPTFGDVFDDIWDFPFARWGLSSVFNFDSGYRPAVESFIKGNELHLRTEIPGIDPKNVSVSLDDGHLCIKGERSLPKMLDGSRVCLEELDYGSFSRCFHVPRGIDRANIRARYELGMLDITIPLKNSLEKKTIPIEGMEGKAISIEGEKSAGSEDPVEQEGWLPIHEVFQKD